MSGPLKRLLHPDDRIPNSRDRYYLMKYDVATGLSERLTYGSHNVYLNDISPDGQETVVQHFQVGHHSMPFLPLFSFRD